MSKMIEITNVEYSQLLFVQAQMNAMEAAGVDNWEGFDLVEWPNEEDFFENDAKR